MHVDKVYLQSIRELEAEKNVMFPKHIINEFSEKIWMSTDYHIYVNQCYYAAHSVEGSEIYWYNFFKNYSWHEVK
uniref:Uncharacterized protein n=1 Tax=viral metagenome TaxID=1070528 RepID=A0A6C0KST0_9ZZZZ